ncbi:MAG: SDR family oxidoreductase [Dehalococcoidia bacterium]|nr:SDR family oxidoreductase [Dehalococcoidia bacterium]
MIIKRFEGKVAVVSGASQGIGRAIALRLAREGAKVAFFDIAEAPAMKVVEEIKAAGSEGYCEVVNSKDGAKIQAFVKNVIAKFGTIDVLVNSVGADVSKPFLALTEAEIDNSIAINLKGHAMLTQAVVGMCMKEKKYGKIVTISSDAAHTGQANSSMYAACKSGILGLSRTWAREFVRYAINVNVVCPGPTLTPAMQKWAEVDPKNFEATKAGIPMRRLAEPDDIASAVAYLVSDDASYITGQALSVNGGLYMH